MDDLACVFDCQPDNRVSLVEALEHQTHFLHGDDYHAMRWLPRPIFVTITALQDLARCKPYLVAAALVSE